MTVLFFTGPDSNLFCGVPKGYLYDMDNLPTQSKRPYTESEKVVVQLSRLTLRLPGPKHIAFWTRFNAAWDKAESEEDRLQLVLKAINYLDTAMPEEKIFDKIKIF